MCSARPAQSSGRQAQLSTERERDWRARHRVHISEADRVSANLLLIIEASCTSPSAVAEGLKAGGIRSPSRD